MLAIVAYTVYFFKKSDGFMFTLEIPILFLTKPRDQVSMWWQSHFKESKISHKWNSLKQTKNLCNKQKKQKCKNNFGKNLANDLVFKQVPNALKTYNFDENTG